MSSPRGSSSTGMGRSQLRQAEAPAAIVIDEQMLNIPGRGSVRPVQDAMLAVSLAPDDPALHHLAFDLMGSSPPP